MGRGILLTSNLPQLQNLIKRDPDAYREEFLQQYSHYSSIRQLFESNPDEQAQNFRELVTFISHVAQCYPKETATFPSQLSKLLLESYTSLSPDTRKTLVQNLVMLRNKNVITSIDLLRTLFPLLPRTTSSSLRSFIRKTILTDIRTANMKSQNHKLNRAVQSMLFSMVESGMQGEVTGDKGKLRGKVGDSGPTNDSTSHNGSEAMWAVILTQELWKKGIWKDAKTVSIVALGCFHPVMKVQSASIHFFLGSEDDEPDSENEGEPDVDVKGLQHRHEINKKTRSGEKKLHKQLISAKKKRKKKAITTSANFPALQLLNDPQTLGEKLYDMLNRYDKRFSLPHKILIMNLLSRVMSAHQLCILGFYTYILKYLTYHQLNVPSILVSLAQSVHELTPPDALTTVIRKIVNEFVHPGVGSEVIAAGINSVREICRRQPWAMEEDLLGDLIEYRKSRDKSVVAASRGLLQLYREVNPGLLKRRERGKEASMGIAGGQQPLPFGHTPEAAVDIEGLALLEDHFNALRGEDEGAIDEDDIKGWEVESDSSEESSEDEEWINVQSDDDDLVISDSEDETEEKTNEEVDEAEKRISTLATTKILTPADFSLLNDLRLQAAQKAVDAGGGSKAKRKLATLEAQKKANALDAPQDNAFISELDILGPRKKAKANYEERMESIAKGREGREKFGSQKGKRRKDGAAGSTTNKEKARNKPIMMIMGSGKVRGKKKSSLRDKQLKLRRHTEQAKKAHH
jgi:protein SDA1